MGEMISVDYQRLFQGLPVSCRVDHHLVKPVEINALQRLLVSLAD